MRERRAFVVSAGGQGRNYLEYMLAHRVALVGWGAWADLTNARKEIPPDAEKLGPKLKQWLSKEANIKHGGRFNLPFRRLIEVDEGDLIIIARWGILGIAAKQPYQYDDRCTIGGWDMYHKIQVESWKTARDSEWERVFSKGKFWSGRRTIEKPKTDIEESIKATKSWREITPSHLPNSTRVRGLLGDEPNNRLAGERYALLGKMADEQLRFRPFERHWAKLQESKSPTSEIDCRDILIRPFVKKLTETLGTKAWTPRKGEISRGAEWHEIDMVTMCLECGYPRAFIEAKKPTVGIYTNGIRRQVERYAERIELLSGDRCNACKRRWAIITNGRQYRFFVRDRTNTAELLKPVADLHFRTGTYCSLWLHDEEAFNEIRASLLNI